MVNQFTDVDPGDLQRWFSDQAIPREFTLGNTKFSMHKLGPMEAYRVWEPYRVELFEKLSNLQLTADTKTVVALAGLLLGVSESVQERARVALFKGVVFQNKTAVTPMELAGNENVAFQDLEVSVVYEVFLRAFALNFIGSLREVVSRITRLLETLPRRPTTT